MFQSAKDVPRCRRKFQPESVTDIHRCTLSVLADTAIATSDHIPLNNLPNALPDRVTDTVTEECRVELNALNEEGEDDEKEMPPLEDIDC